MQQEPQKGIWKGEQNTDAEFNYMNNSSLSHSQRDSVGSWWNHTTAIYISQKKKLLLNEWGDKYFLKSMLTVFLVLDKSSKTFSLIH